MESFRLLWQRPPSDCPLSQLVHASRHVAGGASGKRWGLPISSDSCTVLRITLVLEPRFALTRGLLRIHSVACTCDMSPDTRP